MIKSYMDVNQDLFVDALKVKAIKEYERGNDQTAGQNYFLFTSKRYTLRRSFKRRGIFRVLTACKMLKNRL